MMECTKTSTAGSGGGDASAIATEEERSATNVKILDTKQSVYGVKPLQVPFLFQTQSTNCAPTALAMALLYFRNEARQCRSLAHLDKSDQLIEWISRHARWRPNRATATVGLGVAARMLAGTAIEVELSFAAQFDDSKLSAEDRDAVKQGFTYDRERGASADDIKRLWHRAHTMENKRADRLVVHRRNWTLEELLALMGEDGRTLLLVILDWGVLTGRIGADDVRTQLQLSWFHAVLVIGYDRDHVYLNSPCTSGEAQGPGTLLGSSQPVPRDRFDAARKALGADQSFLKIRHTLPF